MNVGTEHTRAGEVGFKARHLLDAHHRESYERLEHAWTVGKREGLQTELDSQLQHECPAAAYSFCMDHPSFFNLTMLRTLQRSLESRGHQAWADALLELIATRSQKESDLRTLQVKRTQYEEPASLAVSSQPQRSESSSRRGIVLSVSSETAEGRENWSKIALLLARRGYEVIEASSEGFQPDYSEIQDLLEVCRRKRPELIHAAVSYEQLKVVSEGAQRFGISVLWEPPAGQKLPVLRHTNSACHTHYPDAADAELRDLVLSLRAVRTLVVDSPSTLTRLVSIAPVHAVLTNGLSSHSESAEAQEEWAAFFAEAYRDAGASSRVASRPTRNAENDDLWVNPDELSEWTQALAAAPLDDLGAWFTERWQSAEQIMAEGWRFAEFPPIKIDAETDWLNSAVEHRSWGYHLHTWELMDPVVEEYLSSGSQGHLEWLLDVAVSWAEQCLQADADHTMAWYDMSVALRSPRLAGIIHLALEAGVSDDRMEPLLCLAMAHQDAHVAENSFNSANNHGFYAALGQLCFGRALRVIPGMVGLIEQGAERMRVMARQQFLEDGTHAEHSPDYHRMLLDSFERAIDQQIITDEVVIERIRRASHVLGWFIQPNGTLVQFGDSPSKQMVRAPHVKPLDPVTRFFMSRGNSGRPTDKDLFVSPDAGYAIIRTPAPQTISDLAAASYLALAGGFHSRAHKHCDDLSLVWFHRGEEILVDAGRYGYGAQLPVDSPLRKDGFYYNSRQRQFVESARAHNVVTVDGKNHNRRRPPFGSGLQRAVKESGVFQIEATAPQDGWSWKRSIHLDPTSGLIVIDDIESESEAEQTYQVYFNFDGDLSLAEDESGVTIQGSKADLRMYWSDNAAQSSLARGQESPLRGWRSLKDRQLVPTWSHERSGVFTGHIRLKTIIDTP